MSDTGAEVRDILAFHLGADRQRLADDTRLHEELGADSVPFIVYRNAKSGVYGSHTGGMSTEQLAEMVGA